MHLKSLTVRGFKSFASATTFDFEPGVTAVVGPNGSGKSNVVDALAWVMGEQGAKTLRGGKMEDVIFAGTSGRSPLGRAQVSLTIDNADGALPIEYTEVTISRTLFRTGGSEYAINGSNCRLLDIQELLSDSGLGREMHVIVGQGQLDRILHATPDDRRGFVEEAAGILKHRRRKEKTVRKLESMQANLARLTDLTGELRRQLTPLGKQAEVARRAQQVQFEVRDARARLLADDLVQLTAALAQEVADEAAMKARQAEVERTLEAGRRRLAELERLAAEATPRLNAARDAWYQLSSARERFRSLGNLANERRRLLGNADAEPETGRDPDQLEQQAAQVREEQAELEFELEDRREALEDAVQTRAEAEASAVAEDQRLTAILRAAADRREGLAKLAGQVAAARSRVEAAEAELGRLRASIGEGEERRRKAQTEFSALESQVAGVEEGEEGLDAEYEQASQELDAIEEELESLVAEEREAERERDALSARKEALEVGLDRRDGSEALLASGSEGVLGPLAELITVEPGYEPAIAAALGNSAEAVVVAGRDAGVQALELMKSEDSGRIELVFARTADPAPAGQAPADQAAADQSEGDLALPGGAVPALALVTLKEEAAAVRALLASVVVVEDLSGAAEAVSARPELTAVTRDGEVFSAYSARGGSAGRPSLLEVQAAVEETAQRLAHATARAERAKFAIAAATARRAETAARAEAALEQLNESDARLAAVAERLGHLGSTLRSAVGESERIARLVEAAEANVATEQQKLAEITQRLGAAQEAPAEVEPSTEQRDALAAAATRARQSEMEARLALRSGEEQLNAIGNRAASLERAAATERHARAQAAERARKRQVQAAKAAAVGRGVKQVLAWLDVSVDLAERERDAAEEVRAARERELATVRTSTDALANELRELTDSVHRDEMARAQQRLRIESLETKAIDELGLTPDHLVAEYGPDQPVPVATAASNDKWAALREEVDEDGNPVIEGVPFVRAEQEKRLKKAQRDLSSLGKVNPLALEEFAALEERHQYLSGQLEDLKATRKDLLDIIKEVDERVERVFTEAYHDTAAQFERVFGRLFPGGEGRLVLTDPDDMLTTGIEVEARPAGKKIKRLSLLSGGERSLTAVALLVAIFKARPSPFYVMDEVEAALDDTNLGRLITIFEELRESSQLIVITHQKRTMEVADALYGVTMRGDGVSTVISQRLATAEV
ncbi:chromosome segregation protein SMC [Arthrobacter sp. VKM Ac-2550]|uniref:chromosome segregation protein SMC n=1 Tax=Crystallibacter permensis TaxID=1938888 RepID=UPI0022269817|nr:chromosome segregation protein SMC [Arthrobacter sp. VKM Ac-2550]MCW2131780.1 condensin subunit Smc [Arthrobacter sp. VKM Ac-2550]